MRTLTRTRKRAPGCNFKHLWVRGFSVSCWYCARYEISLCPWRSSACARVRYAKTIPRRRGIAYPQRAEGQRIGWQEKCILSRGRQMMRRTICLRSLCALGCQFKHPGARTVCPWRSSVCARVRYAKTIPRRRGIAYLQYAESQRIRWQGKCMIEPWATNDATHNLSEISLCPGVSISAPRGTDCMPLALKCLCQSALCKNDSPPQGNRISTTR